MIYVIFGYGQQIFLLGLAIMSASFAMMLIGILCFRRAKKRLSEKLEAEYGRKRH